MIELLQETPVELSDAPVGAWIALGGFGVAIIALIVWILVRGRKIKWPEGSRVTRKLPDLKIHVMRGEGLPKPEEELVEKCILAIRAVRRAWVEVMGERGAGKLDEVLIKFVSDEEWKGLNINGTMSFISAATGRRQFPGIFIRDRFEPDESRDPLIAHEAIHALGFAIHLNFQANQYHMDERLWGRDKEGTVENLADKYYRESL